MFSLGVFGYITAALASFFVDKEQTADKPRRGSEDSIDALRADVQTLIREVRQMRERNPSK
jgi:hypothetical protein